MPRRLECVRSLKSRFARRRPQHRPEGSIDRNQKRWGRASPPAACLRGGRLGSTALSAGGRRRRWPIHAGSISMSRCAPSSVGLSARVLRWISRTPARFSSVASRLLTTASVTPKHQVKLSSFMIGRAVEKAPDLAREIVKRGHEAAAHGRTWQNSYFLDPEAERKFIADSVETIQKVTGQQPIGWNAYWMRNSPHTRTSVAAVRPQGSTVPTGRHASSARWAPPYRPRHHGRGSGHWRRLAPTLSGDIPPARRMNLEPVRIEHPD
jgi:hypothetical protein